MCDACSKENNYWRRWSKDRILKEKKDLNAFKE
jgi:hypothetical protein